MAKSRLLILSDLHALDSRFTVPAGPNAPPSPPGMPSWLDYSGTSNRDKNPMTSFRRLIAEIDLKAEYLVVPGDLCDRANGEALRQAWEEIEQVRRATGAALTVATAGNHDMDSRYRLNPYDPTDALKSLVPAFPLVDPRAHAEYWGYQVTEVEHGELRFVSVNSCAFHGGAAGEINHGRISRDALRRLRAIVSQPNGGRKNVIVCHHHPHPIPGEAFGKDDRMLDGESLLDLLDESGNEWLVIHGHRHLAQLVYASGSAASPTVLAAGSMAVRLDPPLSTLTRNQVHLVTLHDISNLGELRGVVETWDYSPGVGWEPAGDGGGLPRVCGFGHRGSMLDLARCVAQEVHRQGGPVPWGSLIHGCPELQFVTPRDLRRVGELLKREGAQFVSTGRSTYEAAPIE